MKEFKKYQHLEKLGTSEVEGIELGTCYVFPKIDGTNSSIWISNGEVKAGSRTRELSLENDNAGFYAWVLEQKNIKDYLLEYPTHRLFGEWLVKHSLGTYRDDAWRNFYVFDVATDRIGDIETNEEKFNYIHYTEYQAYLEQFNIAYTPPIATIKNGSYEQFVNQLQHNVFLIKDGQGVGEGIVIKNYDFRNNYGRQTWAKIVTSEFKEKHQKVMGGHHVKGEDMIEEEISIKYATEALIEKEYHKIRVESGWSSKNIPQLLNTVYYCVVKEHSWDFIKEHKNPKIDFKRLQFFVFKRVKEIKQELF